MENAFDKIRTYVDHNSIATIGTINLDGTPHGAVVFVCPDDRRRIIYFLTKNGTKKYENLIARDKISLTIANPHENSTLQADGRAEVIRDPATIDIVVKKITRAYATSPDWLPPIAKIRAGAYVIVGIEIYHARLAQFMGMEIGDEHIFTQV